MYSGINIVITVRTTIFYHTVRNLTPNIIHQFSKVKGVFVIFLVNLGSLKKLFLILSLSIVCIVLLIHFY